MPRQCARRAVTAGHRMTSRFLQILRNRAKREVVYSRPEFWDGKAVDYRDSAVSMFPNRHLNGLLERDQFAFMDAALPDVAGAHVLDVGAGTGRLSRHLAGRGARVTSFDFAPAVVEIARALNQGLPIETSVMSVFELEADAAYDHATVLGCLTTACRDRAAFHEVARRLHRALRPGARVAMVEPFHLGFLHRVLALSPGDVVVELRAAGFALENQAHFHFWPARLLLSPVEWPAFVTRPAYGAGEAVLRLLGAPAALGDYTGLALRRLDQPA
ncbi:MAG: class I SAM-dependent methyltransferase [Roseococcus sp.]